MTHRPISRIAHDISKDWGKAKNGINYAAAPYLSAMMSLQEISDVYGFDTGRSVVLYFLSNASSYRGAAARRLKDELKAILKEESA